MFKFKKNDQNDLFLQQLRFSRGIFEKGKRYTILDTDICKTLAERDQVHRLKEGFYGDGKNGKIILPTLVGTELILLGQGTPGQQFMKNLPDWIQRLNAEPGIFDIYSKIKAHLNFDRPAAVEAWSLVQEVHNSQAEITLLSSDSQLSRLGDMLKFQHMDLRQVIMHCGVQAALSIEKNANYLYPSILDEAFCGSTPLEERFRVSREESQSHENTHEQEPEHER